MAVKSDSPIERLYVGHGWVSRLILYWAHATSFICVAATHRIMGAVES